VKLDLRLLELISEKQIASAEPALRLVETISACASSMAVVHRFISLMCPVRSRFLPDRNIDFLRTLASVCGRRRASPDAYLPASADAPSIRVGVAGAPLTRGFTFEITFFREAENARARLLTVQDRAGRSELTVAITDSTLLVNGVAGPVALPSGAWTPLSLAFAPRLASVTISMQGSPPAELAIAPPDGAGANLEWLVGGGDAPAERDSVFISAFSITHAEAVVSVSCAQLGQPTWRFIY
jgi:hypothetical protein